MALKFSVMSETEKAELSEKSATFDYVPYMQMFRMISADLKKMGKNEWPVNLTDAAKSEGNPGKNGNYQGFKQRCSRAIAKMDEKSRPTISWPKDKKNRVICVVTLPVLVESKKARKNGPVLIVNEGQEVKTA